MSTISIITVVKNASKTIGDCLDSVKAQSIQAEHIVVDEASSDGTLDVLRERRSELAEVVSEPDLGMYDAMNKLQIRVVGTVE